MHDTASGIPSERVAAIVAALAAVLDQPVGSFAVTSIGPVEKAALLPSGRVWSKAGLLESHLARRQFGLRSR